MNPDVPKILATSPPHSRGLYSKQTILTLLCLALIGILYLSLAMGAVTIEPQELWDALLRQGDTTDQVIVWELRMPRAVIAMVVGAALGTAGALLQGMLGNGLADPFLLGISAGAGLAAVGLLTLGSFTSWVPVAAWVGGLGTTGLVYGLARTQAGIVTERLILAGVAVSALFGAVSSTLLLMADERIQIALNWLIGSLSGRGWVEIQVAGPFVGTGLIASVCLAQHLNLLSLGEEMAQGLGLSVNRSRLMIGVVATLLAASAVSVSGLIGFVGLVVPHIVRLVAGQDYRWVLPLSAIGGALLLSTADIVARLGSVELPVGVVTALLGAPFFGWLLYRRGQR